MKRNHPLVIIGCNFGRKGHLKEPQNGWFAWWVQSVLSKLGIQDVGVDVENLANESSGESWRLSWMGWDMSCAILCSIWAVLQASFHERRKGKYFVRYRLIHQGSFPWYQCSTLDVLQIREPCAFHLSPYRSRTLHCPLMIGIEGEEGQQSKRRNDLLYPKDSIPCRRSARGEWSLHPEESCISSPVPTRSPHFDLMMCLLELGSRGWKNTI